MKIVIPEGFWFRPPINPLDNVEVEALMDDGSIVVAHCAWDFRKDWQSLSSYGWFVNPWKYHERIKNPIGWRPIQNNLTGPSVAG